MFKSCKTAIAAAVLAAGLGAGVAQAAFITGSISVADGLLGLPAAPSGSAVSGLTGIQPDGNGLAFGCTTDFVGTCPGSATMTAWDFVGPFPDIIVINGFTFDLTAHGAITPTALTCGGGSCSDALVVASLTGIVSKAGFEDSLFTGSLTFSGSCVGAGNDLPQRYQRRIYVQPLRDGSTACGSGTGNAAVDWARSRGIGFRAAQKLLIRKNSRLNLDPAVGGVFVGLRSPLGGAHLAKPPRLRPAAGATDLRNRS